MARADDFYARLRTAASRGQIHGGVRGRGLDDGGKPTPEDQDDSMYGDNVRWHDQPNGQMVMSEGTQLEYHLPKTTTVDHGDGHSSTHLWAEDTQPYAARPVPQGKQLPLGKSGAFQPTDPALHTLRAANPHLNEYDFRIQGTHPNQIHTVTAIHTPTGQSAGSLSWKGKGYAETVHPGEGREGEVEMVNVYDQHRGRGLSSAMWDYAHFHASRDGSEIAHPVHSDNRSVEGNHWAHFVGGASMARTKGFNVKEY